MLIALPFFERSAARFHLRGDARSPRRIKDNGFVFRRGQNLFHRVAFPGGFELSARGVFRRFRSGRQKRAGFLVGSAGPERLEDKRLAESSSRGARGGGGSRTAENETSPKGQRPGSRNAGKGHRCA